MFPALSAIRAFSVTFGGSVAVDAAAGASITCVARHGRRAPAWAKAGTAITALYLTAGRRWMAGRHQVEVDAPAEDVWPWLAQLGQDRGGFYSYDFLENLAGCDMRSADRIHPEWQHRDVGDIVYLHPLNGLPVTRFEPGHLIALENWGSFEVEPLGPQRSHLFVDNDEVSGIRKRLFYLLLMELPHYIMERKMLLGIKRRAEAAARHSKRVQVAVSTLRPSSIPTVQVIRPTGVRTTQVNPLE